MSESEGIVRTFMLLGFIDFILSMLCLVFVEYPYQFERKRWHHGFGGLGALLFALYAYSVLYK